LTPRGAHHAASCLPDHRPAVVLGGSCITVVRIIGATIIPFKAPYMSPADFLRAEAVRDQVNHWIRTSGEFDAVVDFAKAVADPADPEELNPAYNSGDFLHPHDAGYRAIAAAIKLNEL